ncbi:MAG: hypothetical protein IKR36_03385 [Clostridia bacterium]|nr:hypothetical protein [Clostridia bacterium]
MNGIRINDKISYIEASDNPLSADIGIIEDNGSTWLYDVGNGEKSISGLDGSYHVVLSHFHPDHTGNISRVRTGSIYVSRETYAHVQCGTVVNDDLYIGNLHIFPLPSSHTKGSLGLEVDGEYAFIGDALYSKVKDGYYIYNAQLLKNEIQVLSALRAPNLLVSHFKGLIREKVAVIDELRTIYGMREKNTSEIMVRIDSD